MKKFAFALLLLVLLTGLPGCKTTRETHKTDTKQEVRQTVATDSNRAEKVTTSEQINAVLLNSEKQNVVIAFDEWEYYPAVSDTITGENYAQISGNSMRTNGEADKPPNAGSVKKHRTGTITINAEKQTEQTSEKQTTTTADTKTDVKTKTKTDIKTKEKTKTIETTRKGNGVFWFVVIFVFVVLLVCIVIVRRVK